MATATMHSKANSSHRTTGARRTAPVPRVLRGRVEALLNDNYAYMDSPIFRRRNIERDLFTFADDHEPQLPLTAWYQPTRDDVLDSAIVGAPQLMKGDEERM